MELGFDKIMALIQAAGSLVVAATVVVYWRQLLAMKQNVEELQESRRRQQLYQALSFLIEMRPNIQHIFSLENKPFSAWEANDIDHAEFVCTRFNLVGVLVIENMLPVDILAKTWFYGIPKCHRILMPYIEKIRSERDKRYWSAFDALTVSVQHISEKFSGFDVRKC